MTEESPYRDWQGVEQAMKAAAAMSASRGGVGVGDQLVRARFDRFLSRVFAAGSESGWLLKGGTSILARVPEARHTQDLDLAASQSTLDEAVEDLRARVQRDLGDHLSFELVSVRATGQGDTQPDVQTRQVTFACFAGGGAARKRFGEVKVDLVVGPPPTGDVEVIEPAARLQLARPLQTSPYRLFPLVDQVAEKVCATMSTAYPGGRPSSRVKDLVDLVVIARTQIVPLRPLQLAIATQQIHSRLDPFEQLVIPEGWGKRYQAMAAATPPAAAVPTVERASELMESFLTPALAPGRALDAVAWRLDRGWTDVAELTKEPPASESPAAVAGGDVWVRPHTRNGQPIAGHWRSPRASERGSGQ
ncbi:nucleotidyl transferase AbiEii/AbiGii toxin family protein [Microbacterium maritypicum]|uniref:nucleotidyl transferase AbiEii/AbiGii toxin family protein n=1 Tax=Microbacterium maritypicum TaxID=33918 RepID=UPI003A957636